MQKMTRMPQPVRSADEHIDRWMHAVALVILRRQMHGKWTRRFRASRLTLA
jgi:hypothetical protein